MIFDFGYRFFLIVNPIAIGCQLSIVNSLSGTQNFLKFAPYNIYIGKTYTRTKIRHGINHYP